MKLKQLFCRHKKLTAVGIYEKVLEDYEDLETKQRFRCVGTFIVCKCDKCCKEFEYLGRNLDLLRHEFRKEINVDNVANNKLWGKWWSI